MIRRGEYKSGMSNTSIAGAFLAATLGVLAALVCGGMLALCLMLIGG